MSDFPLGEAGPPGEQRPARPEVQPESPARDSSPAPNDHDDADLRNAALADLEPGLSARYPARVPA